nr:uncharacterized protein LOC117222954 [Megalopta genalis]
MSEESSSISESSSPPTKRRASEQTFRDKWLEDPTFSAWLAKSDNVLHAWCRACKKNLKAKKSNLDLHSTSQMHILSMQSLGEMGTNGSTIGGFESQVKRAEIRYTLDVVDHNLSFYSRGHFIGMAKEVTPDNVVLQHCTLKRSKMAMIVKNVLSKYIVEETMSILRNKYFSLLMDESTDISSTKHVCLLARYVDGPQIKTYLLDYIRINEANAESLFQCLMYCLERNNLPINNLVGFSLDNASVAVGTNNSVVTRLLAINKEICVIPCIRHLFHLVTKHAYSVLPEDVGDFLSGVYSYFSKSDKRKQALEAKQKALNMTKLIILEPCLTRWLTLYKSIERILSQWPALWEVFRDASKEKKSLKAQALYNVFEQGYIKAYLEFLKLPLELFTEYNIVFQKSDIAIHTLLRECTILTKHIAQFFIKPQCIQASNTFEINVDEEENLLPLEEIYIGEEALATINQLKAKEENNAIITEFYVDVQNFYRTAYKELGQRIPHNESFLNSLNFLKPKIALEIGHSVEPIYNIIAKYPTKFDKIRIAREWRLLPTSFTSDERQEIICMDIKNFWHRISTEKGPDGITHSFKNISKLAELCMTLPHSNADVESLFSHVTNIKTFHRNKLQPGTVCALARVKLDLQNKQKDSETYPIPDEMIKLHNSKMYERESLPSHLKGVLLLDNDSASESSDNEIIVPDLEM